MWMFDKFLNRCSFRGRVEWLRVRSQEQLILHFYRILDYVYFRRNKFVVWLISFKY